MKALRLIQSTPVISYFAKSGRRGNARGIVDQWMTGAATEVPLYYPMTTEHAFDSPVYVAVPWRNSMRIAVSGTSLRDLDAGPRRGAARRG